MNLKVAIAGASGYVGGELARLIAEHPQLDLVTVTANTNAGEKFINLHPHLRSFAHLNLVATTAENLAGHDIVFLALPHAKSAEVAALLSDDVLVIDCGADFRLESSDDWEKFYGGTHAGSWAYGMPELLIQDGKQRTKLAGVRQIAVPGCNVTAVTFGLAPALAAGLIEAEDIVSVLTVGTSGAGRGATEKLFEKEPTGSANAYQVGGIHRHIPEIEQNLSKSAGKSIQISFTPVLASLDRGILSVNTAKLKAGVTAAQLHAAYSAAYSDEEFVDLLPLGEYPSTADTIGINKAVSAARREGEGEK